MVRRWMNYAGPFLLIWMGIFLYSWDTDFSTAGTSKLALTLIITGLVWGGLAFNSPLRKRRYHRILDGSLRASAAPGTRYLRHRGSRYLAARPFAGGERRGVAMNPPVTVAGESFVKDSLLIAGKEVKKNLFSARYSMWALLSGIVLSLTSSDLLLTDKELSVLEQNEILYTVTSLSIGLGLLVTGILAVDSVAGEKQRTTLEGVLSTPTERGALLLGKVWSVLVTWLLNFVISAPFILVVGFGTSALWGALTYTFLLGTVSVAGFAAITVGISALLRTGRGVALASITIFIALVAPILLSTTLLKSWFGNIYTVLSPVAQARLLLQGLIVEREGLLAQLPQILTLAAFAVIAGLFATFASRGISLEGGEWHKGREAWKPWGPHEASVQPKRTGSRPGGMDPD
jgi:ABC-type transport system involved in multi-copper enzyme maturation permease subunit